MSTIDFEQIYHMYEKRMLCVAYRYSKDKFSAEDIVQEAFLKAFRKIDSVEDPAKMGGWLTAITARTAIDFLRAEKRRNWMLVDSAIIEPLLGMDANESTTETEVSLRIFREELHDSLENLSKEFQEVLILKAQYGLKEREIASMLDIKSATVKTRLYRARKQLKQIVADRESA